MKSKTAHLKPHTDFLWSREDYEDLVQCGIFGPEDHIELLNGRLITMAPQHSPHVVACNLTQRYLQRIFSQGYHVRPQFPLALDARSEPEPDVAVVRGEIRDYGQGHPRPEDTVLIVEVADSSLKYDRTEKLEAYARNGIQEYWILNLVDRVLEVYREPSESGYGVKTVVSSDEEAAPPGREADAIAVAELLP